MILRLRSPRENAVDIGAASVQCSNLLLIDIEPGNFCSLNTSLSGSPT
jgi:hypothetical protein